MKKLRKYLPRLSRKQKLARNLAVVAVCLFLLNWMMEFPCWTRAGLLRRAERMYLLEGTELLYDGRGNNGTAVSWPTLYARNGDVLMTVQYSQTPMGLRLSMADLYREPDNIHCFKRMRILFDPMIILAFGDLEAADRAVLEYSLQVTIGTGSAKRVLLAETYITEGQRLAPGAFVFDVQPHYGEDNQSGAAVTERKLFNGEVAEQEDDAVLRLYDAEGNLIHEKHMDRLEEKVLAW